MPKTCFATETIPTLHLPSPSPALESSPSWLWNSPGRLLELSHCPISKLEKYGKNKKPEVRESTCQLEVDIL